MCATCDKRRFEYRFANTFALQKLRDFCHEFGLFESVTSTLHTLLRSDYMALMPLRQAQFCLSFRYLRNEMYINSRLSTSLLNAFTPRTNTRCMVTSSCFSEHHGDKRITHAAAQQRLTRSHLGRSRCMHDFVMVFFVLLRQAPLHTLLRSGRLTRSWSRCDQLILHPVS